MGIKVQFQIMENGIKFKRLIGSRVIPFSDIRSIRLLDGSNLFTTQSGEEIKTVKSKPIALYEAVITNNISFYDETEHEEKYYTREELNPLIAAAVYGLAGLDAAIVIDLISFAVAFIALACFITIPEVPEKEVNEGSFLSLVKEGLVYLKDNPLILYIILFLAGVNFIASAFDAVLPAFIIPSPKGGNSIYGIVTSFSGIAMVVGSLIATAMPKPKNRVRVIYASMFFSLGTENFLLAFSRSPVLWCIAEIIGWIFVPVMSTNQTVIMRNSIPERLQGRVYACRNTLQFFTIPIGLLFGGVMVDEVCEPIMKHSGETLQFLFGSGKGSGAALMLFILGVLGTTMCLVFGQILKKYNYSD